jgi:hypothetical protein
MYPVIHQSVHDAKTQTNTGHQDIFHWHSTDSIKNTNTTTNTRTESPATTRTNPTASTATNPAATAANASRVRQRHVSSIRRHLQQSRSHLTTTNTAAPAWTSTNRIRTHILAIRQRFQQAAEPSRNNLIRHTTGLPGAQQRRLSLSKPQHHEHTNIRTQQIKT